MISPCDPKWMWRSALLFSVLSLVSPPVPSGSMAVPGNGTTGSIPLSNLPKASPEELEHRRRVIEQMDRERDEKERTALRDSPEGQWYCAMMRTQISDAESGVLRGQSGERRLTPDEQRQVVPTLRGEYEKACR